MFWSSEKTMNAISDVATNPSSVWTQQTGKAGYLFTKAGDPVKYMVDGGYDGIALRVIVQGDEIITGFPLK